MQARRKKSADGFPAQGHRCCCKPREAVRGLERDQWMSEARIPCHTPLSLRISLVLGPFILDSQKGLSTDAA